jgi:hypothetical protein
VQYLHLQQPLLSDFAFGVYHLLSVFYGKCTTHVQKLKGTIQRGNHADSVPPTVSSMSTTWQMAIVNAANRAVSAHFLVNIPFL